jgi:type I restriction enzyme S subunit
MIDSWTEVPFEELAAPFRNAIVGGPFGSDLVSKDYVSSGTPVIRGQNMQGRWVGGEFVYVTDAKAHSLLGNLARAGDLIFTQRGTLGQVALVPNRGAEKYLVSQSQMKATIDPSKADPVFLYYFFSSAAQQEWIRSNAIQTGVPHTNLGILKRHPVLLPPLPEQRMIASVLSSLDDKIEQNRRTGLALERLARATFKAWFVDFEPVKAKAAGAAGFRGMPPDAFDALPNSLTDSGIGPVPQGWAVGTMGDVGEQRRDQIAPGQIDDETPYIGLEHMPRRDVALCEWGAAASVTSSKFRFRRGDVLFGKLRPYFHKVGPAPLDGVCSTDIVVLYPKQPEYAAWLLMFVSSNDFVAHTDRSSAGTKMPRTNWNDMAAFAATVPSPALASAFQEWAGPMLELIAASIHESRKLAALRDYLLPRLLSGRVRVRPSRTEVKV